MTFHILFWALCAVLVAHVAVAIVGEPTLDKKLYVACAAPAPFERTPLKFDLQTLAQE